MNLIEILDSKHHTKNRKPISVGSKFGILTVIEDGGVAVIECQHNKSGIRHASLSVAQCACGNRCVVENRLLRSGNNQSCGCTRAENAGKVLKVRHEQGFFKLLERNPNGTYKPFVAEKAGVHA